VKEGGLVGRLAFNGKSTQKGQFVPTAVEAQLAKDGQRVTT